MCGINVWHRRLSFPGTRCCLAGAAGGKAARYCPWFSTMDGCPLHACPFSHARLPTHLVTYKYRAWAFEVAEYGWVGEPINGPAAPSG